MEIIKTNQPTCDFSFTKDLKPVSCAAEKRGFSVIFANAKGAPVITKFLSLNGEWHYSMLNSKLVPLKPKDSYKCKNIFESFSFIHIFRYIRFTNDDVILYPRNYEIPIDCRGSAYIKSSGFLVVNELTKECQTGRGSFTLLLKALDDDREAILYKYTVEQIIKIAQHMKG